MTARREGYAVIWDVDGMLLDSGDQRQQAWTGGPEPERYG